MQASLSPLSAVGQFDDFEVLDFAPVDDESYQRSFLVESVQPGGTGVDVQTFQCFVIEHFQDVRVARDEELGRVYVDLRYHLAGIFAGVSADVCNPHVDSFDGKPLVLWVAQAQLVAVDIAIDRPEGFQRLEPVGQLYRADVARVPNLVALGKIFLVAVVPPGVGVGQQTYLYHRSFLNLWVKVRQ